MRQLFYLTSILVIIHCIFFKNSPLFSSTLVRSHIKYCVSLRSHTHRLSWVRPWMLVSSPKAPPLIITLPFTVIFSDFWQNVDWFQNVSFFFTFNIITFLGSSCSCTCPSTSTCTLWFPFYIKFLWNTSVHTGTLAQNVCYFNAYLLWFLKIVKMS